MLAGKLTRKSSNPFIPSNGSSTGLPPSEPLLSSGANVVPSFDDLVASYHMPPPGPDYYHARRQLWLTPQPDKRRSASQDQQISTSRSKLEKMLQSPGAAYSDSCWKNGVERVWKGLSKGDSLKYRLPMDLIIKVVHASWVRDDTWPADSQDQDPDDELPKDVHIEPIVLERIQDPSTPS